ncbi:phosphoglycerate dehydrogenase [Desulfonema ishimotonii]|uniref:D-3-phosphoglycerate dehydrogenase n=1 Tax=Desulfonema ishimotonii TaxID=45657 RepID=A0A401G2C1_9BACT|nr:phosphoglycerate dehydrogenase [Desulfonema ishimotonii]GBC63388.1 phosphoglycerate dehydrogenase [Desulfonema ishimotonii]
MYKVMIRDNMSPVAKEILEATGRIEVVVDNDKATSDPDVLAGLIGEFDGLAVRSGTKVTKALLESAPNLKVIGRAGIGVDNIDLEAATRKGIVVMNAPGGNTVTTGEHTISMMMALARNIPQATASLRAGKWEKKKLGGVEITGKTLGIVGLGHIGRVVAERARGLRMKVIAFDPYVSQEAAAKMDVRLVRYEELLATSDFITLHVPRLKETVNMINAETLAQMKPGVRLINCSRGEVIHLDDLYEALESGHVAGAAIDVFPKEPPDASLPIMQHPKVIFTPHLGASTGEAQVNVARMIAEQMTGYLLDGVITNAVNFPSVSMEEMARLRPYLTLAEKMGAMMGQLVRSVHDVTIDYCGEVATLATRPVTHALLKGLLGAFTHKPINYVNARAIAAEKGIGIRETVSQSEEAFSSLIKLKLEGTDEKPDEIWGTIYEKKYPRFIRIGDVYLDAIPEGAMIVIQNIDKPGVIGHVGTVLGCHNINIGRFQLGRREDHAVCLVNIDTPADEAVLEEIRSLPIILSVRQVDLG